LDLVKISILLTILSALFAIAAAVLWFVSAVVKTPESFNIYVVRPYGVMPLSPMGATYLGQGQSPDLVALAGALRRQSKFSALAAGCAGISALLQTASLLV
jgi:uncharacterized protein YjfI (DUF2170 family)